MKLSLPRKSARLGRTPRFGLLGWCSVSSCRCATRPPTLVQHKHMSERERIRSISIRKVVPKGDVDTNKAEVNLQDAFPSSLEVEVDVIGQHTIRWKEGVRDVSGASRAKGQPTLAEEDGIASGKAWRAAQENAAAATEDARNASSGVGPRPVSLSAVERVRKRNVEQMPHGLNARLASL